MTALFPPLEMQVPSKAPPTEEVLVAFGRFPYGISSVLISLRHIGFSCPISSHFFPKKNGISDSQMRDDSFFSRGFFFYPSRTYSPSP